MAGPPTFPGAARAKGGDAYSGGARANAGNGDASRLANQIQAFCDAHDGERGYEQACAKGREFITALHAMKSPDDRGDTPGRRAASKVQQGTTPPSRDQMMQRMRA
jgi:hypothetical protein